MRPKSGIVSLVVVAGGVAGWLVACATVSVVPLDGPETDDATTEAAPEAAVTTDAADAADSAEAATEAAADASDMDSAPTDADSDAGD